MRITRLTAENFKKLKAVDITPEGDMVMITGKNAQGKSSVLDAIWAACAGKAGVKQVERPIRDGEKNARVVLELEDLRIERKWTASGSTLTVGPRDGSSKFNSPQAILDKLIGSLSFDPLAFAHADAKTQVATLVNLTGREADFERIARQRKAAYDDRTLTNRDVKRLQAQVDGLPAESGAVARVDVGELLEQIQIEDRRASLRLRWTELQREIERLQVTQAEVAGEAADLPAPVATRTELQERLNQAEVTNQSAAASERRQELADQLSDAADAADALTEQISVLDAEKVELLASSELPVPGLSFDDDGVLYNGVPFQQASNAERIRVSVGMAMALNPELRVIRITDGSLLDSDNLALIESMAAANDFQCWIEKVDESGEIGVVIEDGSVKA